MNRKVKTDVAREGHGANHGTGDVSGVVMRGLKPRRSAANVNSSAKPRPV